MVKCWNRAEDLPGLIAVSLSKAIKMFPATGRVRANVVANQELLSKLNGLRKENKLVKARIAEIEQRPSGKVEGLADLDNKFTIRGRYSSQRGGGNWQSTLTWREIFAYVAPYLLKFPNDEYVKLVLANALKDRERSISSIGYSHQINDQDFQTVTLQLKALGLINTKYSQTTKGGMALFWLLTPQGERLMMELRTVRAPQTTVLDQALQTSLATLHR